MSQTSFGLSVRKKSGSTDKAENAAVILCFDPEEGADESENGPIRIRVRASI